MVSGLLGLGFSEGHLLSKGNLTLKRLSSGTGGSKVGLRSRKLGAEFIKGFAVGGLLGAKVLDLGSKIVTTGSSSCELCGGKCGIGLGLCL